MKTRFNISSLVLSVTVASLFLACAKTEETPPAPLTATTAKDIPADPTVSPGAGQPPTGTGKFTLFSLKNNAIVPNSDSASTKWDVGFRSTVIIVNGGTSGPGQGAALVQDGIFNELKTAPTTGYAQDAKPNYAITASSGKGWYNYNPQVNQVTPIAGKVIFLKTAEGKYAKMEILSYYKGAPATIEASTPARYYTFRYVYQPDGSTKLE